MLQFQFRDKNINTKELYSDVIAYKIDDVNIEKLVLNNSIPATNGKHTRYVIGYRF